jgi:hypothetical protein
MPVLNILGGKRLARRRDLESIFESSANEPLEGVTVDLIHDDATTTKYASCALFYILVSSR